MNASMKLKMCIDSDYITEGNVKVKEFKAVMAV